ncbi:MAG TPA: hypothetical protein VE135_13465 [Pyrinomonadaceae bacterium]|nr:hypothetical protein [Pyrinomonadaceae bacterium]
MHASATGQRKAFWDKLFPGQISDTRAIAQPRPTDGLILEGHRLHAIEVGHSDCDDSTVLHVPALGLVVAGDVAYNNVHQYLADGGFNGGIDAWLQAIDRFEPCSRSPWSPATRTQAAQTTHAS